MRSRLALLVAVVVAALLVGAGGVRAAAPPEVALTIEQHRFVPEEIRARAGTPFVLVITNKDATVEEFESHELRLEKTAPAGKPVRRRGRAPRAGRYPFVGEYHEKTATGRIVAE